VLPSPCSPLCNNEGVLAPFFFSFFFLVVGVGKQRSKASRHCDVLRRATMGEFMLPHFFLFSLVVDVNE